MPESPPGPRSHAGGALPGPRPPRAGRVRPLPRTPQHGPSTSCALRLGSRLSDRGPPRPRPPLPQLIKEEVERLEAELKKHRRESQEEFFEMHRVWCTTEGKGKDDPKSTACQRWRDWVSKSEL